MEEEKEEEDEEEEDEDREAKEEDEEEEEEEEEKEEEDEGEGEGEEHSPKGDRCAALYRRQRRARRSPIRPAYLERRKEKEGRRKKKEIKNHISIQLANLHT